MTVLRLIRSVFVVAGALLFTLAISLGSLLNAHVLRGSLTATRRMTVGWGRFILWMSGVSVSREGGGSLDPSEPYVFAANHQSQFDIFVLSGYLGHDFSWLAKKELFQVPLWGKAMLAAGFVPIDRSRGREAMKSLARAAARIAAGTSVVIFPEGTRSPDGSLGTFKPGVMHLAVKAGVPVVPVAIEGTSRILPKGGLLPRSGAVIVRVGEPVEVGGYGPGQRQELADRVRAEVTRLLERNRPEGDTVSVEGSFCC